MVELRRILRHFIPQDDRQRGAFWRLPLEGKLSPKVTDEVNKLL